MSHFFGPTILLGLLTMSGTLSSTERTAAPEQPDLESTRLVMMEIWPRVLGAANVDTAATGTALDIDFVKGGAPVILSRERKRPGFVLRVNRDFVAEDARLIDGMLLASHLNLRESYLSFALGRVVAKVSSKATTSASAQTFNESIGWSAAGFESVRVQRGFRETAAAARRQGYTWLLARAVLQSHLPLQPGAKDSTESFDKRVAELTFELSGSPFAALPTSLLTAALGHARDGATEGSTSCAVAAWLASGVEVMRELPQFERQLEQNPNLHRSMEAVSADMKQLQERGQCSSSS